jgi:hypothetical protein
MAKIFLAYSSSDRSLALPGVQQLRAKGHTVFDPHNDIEPGSNVSDEFDRAIRASEFVVALITGEFFEMDKSRVPVDCFMVEALEKSRARKIAYLIRPCPVKGLSSKYELGKGGMVVGVDELVNDI